MRVGIGLPNAMAGVDGPLLSDWARRAEAGPFSSLGVLDRLPYPGFDPLAVLAGAAAVTSRIGLVTMVVVAPIRATVLLAKQAASIHALSGGRLTLGLAVGARATDYHAAGRDRRGRGLRFSAQLAAFRSLWEAQGVGPSAAGPRGPDLLVGGLGPDAFARVARFGDGYVHGGGPPRAFAGAATRVFAAWEDLGRPGTPALWGQGYFALGPDAEERGARYLRDYYGFTGAFAERIVATNLTAPEAVRNFVRGYAEAGCDELVLLPTVPSVDQVDRLAEVLG